MKIRENKGITLIALVITIIVLLILAGISIASLTGENGLLSKSSEARKETIKAEMKERLGLALQELQIEKLGKASLSEVNQTWMDDKIPEFQNKIIANDASMKEIKVIMRKDGVMGRFIIDEKLNIIEAEFPTDLSIDYSATKINGNLVTIEISAVSLEDKIDKIEIADENNTIIDTIAGEGRDNIETTYQVEFGKKYTLTVRQEDGREKKKEVHITEWYYSITKNLGQGLVLDNPAIKINRGDKYEATIKPTEGYLMETLTVTMGGQPVTVQKTKLEGKISIAKVTEAIEITATTQKIDIEVQNVFINTTQNATSSVDANSIPKGDNLYVTFQYKKTYEDIQFEINPTPIVQNNGNYKFNIIAKYAGKEVTRKEQEVVVNQFELTTGFVQYNAGEWTQAEINELKTQRVYDLNAAREVNKTYKLAADDGLNFTFGGFTYKGNNINGVTTNRNHSINPQDGYGTVTKSGWQILEVEESNGKVYIKKIMHAGSPENLVYYWLAANDGYRLQYFLSRGTLSTGYNTTSSGLTINARNWDMYRDASLNSKNFIKGVHLMTYNEAQSLTEKQRTTGGSYYLETAGNSSRPWRVTEAGRLTFDPIYFSHCLGVRPVVEMNAGVYIASGEGTEESPYVLAKE